MVHKVIHPVMLCLLILSACGPLTANESSMPTAPDMVVNEGLLEPTVSPTILEPTGTDSPPSTATPTVAPTETTTPEASETPAVSDARDWTGLLTAAFTTTIKGDPIQIGVRSVITAEFSFHVMRRTIEGSGTAYYYPDHVCLSEGCQVTRIECILPPEMAPDGQTTDEYFPYEVTIQHEHTPETFIIHLVPQDILMFAFPVLCNLDLQEGSSQSVTGDPGVMISAMQLAYLALEIPKQDGAVVEKAGTEPFLGAEEEDAVMVDYWYSVVIYPDE